jgi:hypothetical protein
VIRQARVRRRVAQTPVVRYENRTTGRTVTLIATMHSGTNAYFGKLNDIIAGLEAADALVCYEGIRPAAEEEWARAADGERAARGFSLPAGGLQALSRHLGWVEQSAGLRYSPSWRNVDITELDLVRQAQPHNVRAAADGFTDLFDGLTPEQFGEVGGAIEAVLLRLLSMDYFDLVWRLSVRGASSDAYRNVARVMVEERNRGALAGLPSDADAVLLWGSGHRPGLAAGLKKAGYRQRITAWVPVGASCPPCCPASGLCGRGCGASGGDDRK